MIMILIRLMVVLPILISAQGYAHELPELGDISQATLTPYQERQLGLQIMRQIRADPRYLDDAEIASYLSNLGHKLIANSNEASIDQTFEFFCRPGSVDQCIRVARRLHGIQQRTHHRRSKRIGTGCRNVS